MAQWLGMKAVTSADLGRMMGAGYPASIPVRDPAAVGMTHHRTGKAIALSPAPMPTQSLQLLADSTENRSSGSIGAGSRPAAGWIVLGRCLLLGLFVLLVAASLTFFVVFLAELCATLSMRLLEI